MPGTDEAIATLLDDESAFLEDAITQAIGTRLREERHRLSLTLQDVADRSGLSLGMISKIENSQTSPSLRTLARLSQALEVPVTTFFRGFEEERDASHVRAGEGIELVRQGTRHGHRYELLAAAKGATAAGPAVPRDAHRAAGDVPALPAPRGRVPLRPGRARSSIATGARPTRWSPGIRSCSMGRRRTDPSG